jgi:Cu/Ag efflux pump CusA
MLAKFGITVVNFNSFIGYALGGEKISDVYEDEKRFPLVLRYNDKTRSTISGIRSSLLDTYDGRKVPLSFIADIESSSGMNAINRENVRRKIVISVNPSLNDVGTIVAQIRKKINDSIVLPENYSLEFGGQFENAVSATRRLVFASVIAFVIIFLILYREFRDGILALTILLNLPLALIGGIFAIKITSNIISIPSIIGFITLFGIATRNGILLISKYINPEKTDMPLKERIISASAERLNPILMTALTAALALIPLAAGGDKPGNEIQSPMAIVILGGLLSSTLLNLIMIPSIYYILENKRNEKSLANLPDQELN